MAGERNTFWTGVLPSAVILLLKSPTPHLGGAFRCPQRPSPNVSVFFRFMLFNGFCCCFLGLGGYYYVETCSQPSRRQCHFYSRCHWGKIIHFLDICFPANFNGKHLLYIWETRATCSRTFMHPALIVCVL